jgi:ABC-type sugar transport system ATPase subunit
MEDQPDKIMLEIKNISKSFPGVQALTDVSLSVMKGEIHGIVGKNGAGKSTLMAVLMGIQQPDSGSIMVGKGTFSSMTPHEALEAGVAYVPQRISMMGSLTVAENILAGEMPTNRLGFVNWREVFREAENRLTKLGLKLDVHSRVEGLSIVEQTMLVIAKALFSHAKLIILDEPTAALPLADIDRLFSFVRNLKTQGVAFIYISHHLEEVFEICDRVTVMRNGTVVATDDVRNLTTPLLIGLMVGEELQGFQRITPPHAEASQPVLEVKDLVRRGRYENIDFMIGKGEVVGLAGLVGSGAASLGMSLFGLERRGPGSVTINGIPFTASNPEQSFSQGLAYLPQDRYQYGLVGIRPVRENVTYPILYRLAMAFGMVNVEKEKKVVEEYIEQLGIVTPSMEQLVSLLSGGNQQKVVFAKLAATQPAVLILHEPTQGIDVQAKLDIYRIVLDLSQQGVAIMIISSEVRELLGICDRILVMYEGKIIHEFRSGEPETTPENILLAIEGGAYVEK